MNLPFTTPPMPVREEWADYNGHLNMAYYHVLFDNALDVVLGPLGLGPLVDASFDIADLSGLALLAARPVSQGQTSLYTVNLETGQATWLGPVGDGRPLRGLAIEP